MGWNSLIKPKNVEWKDTLLSEIPENSLVYFIHSYYVKPENDSYVLATTRYGNQEFCTIIKKDNVFCTQFHPEKSGEIGMNIIRNFGDL